MTKLNSINKLTNFDKQCLKTAISIAEVTFKQGNYPVGAVLAINDKVIGKAGNEINKQKSFVNHAENSLIINFGQKLANVRKDSKKIVSLYSTLEPCIQCLGASVTNHIDRILYIQKDPNGGACDLKHDNIGLAYKEFWPDIIHCPISDKPKQLMIEFFHSEIKRGHIKWPKRMLKLLEST
ncbi:nucleoside deaminase [Patescibacteria group bacterium]